MWILECFANLNARVRPTEEKNHDSRDLLSRPSNKHVYNCDCALLYLPLAMIRALCDIRPSNAFSSCGWNRPRMNINNWSPLSFLCSHSHVVTLSNCLLTPDPKIYARLYSKSLVISTFYFNMEIIRRNLQQELISVYLESSV